MIPNSIALARRQHPLLVVDDAASTRALVVFHLQEAGYTVWSAASGQAALALVAQRGLPHLALLDLQLHDLPGPALAQLLEQQGALRLLFWGASASAPAPVNPADLLVKPLVVSQLLNAVQQRLPAIDGALLAAQEVQIDGRLAFNFAECYVIREDRQVRLSVAENTLLEQLYIQRGQVLSPIFLRTKIHAADPGACRSVATYIYYLRQKLESHPAHRCYIRTVMGQGYMMPLVPGDRQPAVPITIVWSEGRRGQRQRRHQKNSQALTAN